VGWGGVFLEGVCLFFLGGVLFLFFIWGGGVFGGVVSGFVGVCLWGVGFSLLWRVGGWFAPLVGGLLLGGFWLWFWGGGGRWGWAFFLFYRRSGVPLIIIPVHKPS